MFFAHPPNPAQRSPARPSTAQLLLQAARFAKLALVSCGRCCCPGWGGSSSCSWLGFYSARAHTCSDRVSCGQLPVLPLRTPQHCNNTALILTQARQCPCLVWCVCYARWWPVCVSQRPSQRHRSPRSSLDWAELGAGAVAGLGPRCPGCGPGVFTTHPPHACTHQPPASSRDCQEIWGSVEVARVLIMQLLSQHRPLPPSAGACRVEAQYNTVNGEPTNVPALDAVVTRGWAWWWWWVA